MGKNFKEKYSYLYFHGLSQIPYKFLIKFKKKCWRHNYDIGEMRIKRLNIKEKIVNKSIIKQLKDIK